jgi:hypothetical protein
MKAMFPSQRVLLAAALLLAGVQVSLADNFIYGISTPGGQFSFVVTNIPAGTTYPNVNPTLILTAGATYRFDIHTTAFTHPVVIATNLSAFPPVTAGYVGASAQPQDSQPIAVTIPPTNYTTPLFYVCNVHGSFISGRIDILPPPPPNEILSTTVTTTNVMLVSTGVSNTWVLVPEFSSNLLSGAWSPVTGFANTFDNGTNVTTFGRLDAICGPNVFLRIRQSPPQP